jgi:hypothetical protein
MFEMVMAGVVRSCAAIDLTSSQRLPAARHKPLSTIYSLHHPGCP